MEWVSMAEQLHASLTSQFTMSRIRRSSVKHATMDSGAVETCCGELLFSAWKFNSLESGFGACVNCEVW